MQENNVIRAEDRFRPCEPDILAQIDYAIENGIELQGSCSDPCYDTDEEFEERYQVLEQVGRCYVFLNENGARSIRMPARLRYSAEEVGFVRDFILEELKEYDLNPDKEEYCFTLKKELFALKAHECK